jgi:peptide/nickel transport system substrate-binding protein
MKLKTLAVAGAIALALAATPAAAKTFRYAFQGDLNALDPYTLNESFTLGALGNVYEGLTKRDKDLKVIPGLAERWDRTRSWAYLRKGEVPAAQISPPTTCSRPSACSAPGRKSRHARPRT